jgi:hypothetical protein
VAPVRVDILTEITGVEFSNAWKKRVASTFFGVPVHFISIDDLMTNKQALGRSGDLKDLEEARRKSITRTARQSEELGEYDKFTPPEE